MKKIIVLALLCFHSIFAQKQVTSFSTKYKGGPSTIEQSFYLKHSANDESVIFLSNKNKMIAYLLSNTLEQKEIIHTDELPAKYSYIIGGVEINDTYTLFLTNSKSNKFAKINFDFTTKKVSSKEIELDLGNQIFVQTVVYNQKLYLIAVEENSSNLYFYELKNKEDIPLKTIRFKDEDFFVSDQTTLNFNLIDGLNVSGTSKTSNLFQHLASTYSKVNILGFYRKKVEISKVNTKNENTIAAASTLNKLYLHNNLLYISLDADRLKTTVLEINLDTFNGKVKFFNHDAIAIENKFARSNSFLFDNKVHQLVSTKDTLIYQIKEYSSSALLKSIHQNKTDSIHFKNSPFRFKYNSINSSDEGDIKRNKTNVFLRKINAQYNGIAVSNFKNGYKVKIGGAKTTTRETPGGPMVGLSNTLYGNPNAANNYRVGTAYYDPTLFSYNSYDISNSIWIDCLFNDNFEHVEGTVSDSKFERVNKLKNYITEGRIKVNPEGKGAQYAKGANIHAENIFWNNDKLYFGFYQKRDKTYNIFEMKDQ